MYCFFFFKQKTAYEMRISDWSSDVCSSDLLPEQRYCSVGSDNLRGGRRATAHLARLGRRRIAFLGDIEAPEVIQRYQGYLRALEEAGLPVDPALVVPAHFEIEFAEAAVDTLIARQVDFDAIFAASDMIALGAIRSLLPRSEERRGGKEGCRPG